MSRAYVQVADEELFSFLHRAEGFIDDFVVYKYADNVRYARMVHLLLAAITLANSRRMRFSTVQALLHARIE